MELVPDIVDTALFQLCDALDNAEFPLAWQASDGSYIQLEELGKGEMAGWIAATGRGWIAKFSRKRFIDLYADLHLDLDDNDRLDD